MPSRRPTLCAVWLVSVQLLIACSDDPTAPALRELERPAPSNPACSDADGDGFGDGCAKGADCDDADPSVTNGCYRCQDHAPGCPCPYEAQRVPCGKVTVTQPELGTVVCGDGGQVCTNGVWSACELGAYAPGHEGVRVVAGGGG